ncbi:MAG TPA: hypothetical protein PKZ57_02305 [Methanoregulaceae archaeon]|nr:hypothetical protein [Methanoregulaceae archaeon]
MEKDLIWIISVIGIVAIFGGLSGLIKLGWGVWLGCWTLLQILPFFKEDLIIAGLEFLLSFL